MKKYKYDIILIAILLVFSFSSYIYLIFAGSGNNCEVIIVVNNKEEARVSLYQDYEYIVENQYGKNVICIKDNRVIVKSADCPDALCVKQGSISKSGEAIVCLPHKLIVSITEGNNEEMDAVAK